ncbi:MAG: acetylornithine deacetylase [Rhodanobacteraceae bacterium]
MTQGSSLLDATLHHLHRLVAFDTRNPPRAIDTGGIFDYLRAQLPGWDVQVNDHGAGAVSLYAVRGQPKLLFNVHLDTVPDSPRWSASPFELRVTGDRAVGLGACDIKGAAAGLLATANSTNGDMALLFTTDEEGADPRCIRAFLENGPAFGSVLVAEPTCCKAIVAHRGIQSVRVRFEGRAGHASARQAPSDSALHQAVRWGVAALDFAEAQAAKNFGGMRGLRFNIGRIEGGIKANIIAPEATLRFGVRPLPSMDMDDLLERFRTLCEPAPADFDETFRGPPLPADAKHAETNQHAARLAADAWQIPVGDAVDFWTEASLFSQAGYTTFVYGPGDIAQAHSADEWVALGQLRTYVETIHGIVAGNRS